MQKKKASAIKRRKYDEAFKNEVLKMTEHQTVREVSERMGIGENLLYKWRAERHSNLPISEKVANSEVEELKKQLKQVEMDRTAARRDILKKALIIFGKAT